MVAIKEYLAENTEDSVALGKEAFNELDEQTRIDLWLATTKGGVFTTEERKLIKYGYSA